MDPATSDSARPDNAWPPPGERPDGERPDDGRLVDAPTPGGRRRTGRMLALGAGAVLVLALLGAPLGLLWAFLAPDVPVIKTADGAVLAQPQPEEFIAADGWFSLLGIGFGVLVALGVWWLLPRWRGPGGMLLAVTGAVGAALVAWAVGRQIGLDSYRERLADAPIGQTLAKPADLRAGGFEWVFDVIPTVQGDVLLGAFGAVVTYTLLAGWSSHPDLVPGPSGAPDEDVLPGGNPPAGQVSSDSPETRDPRVSPAPPGSGEAGPVRG